MTTLTPIDPIRLLRPHRPIEGISAILLPFLDDLGTIDWPGFRAHVERTAALGLLPAVNMDTGYVNLLDDATRARAPDGIVCSSGGGAIAVNAGIEAAGFRLGRDIDMVAKQSTDVLNWIRPEIITIYEDVRHGGRELAKSVIARIDGIEPELLQSISSPVWPKS